MHGHGENPNLCYFNSRERAIPGNVSPRRLILWDHVQRVHDYTLSESVSPPEPPSGGPSKVKLRRKRKSHDILDLVDPTRHLSGSQPVQKHPATFQCEICPKRFTRAFNLRSHRLTHCGERPFVCPVCGRGFVRQHDQKTHQNLHSGERRFVCKGDLSRGAKWGCGRRFSRLQRLNVTFALKLAEYVFNPCLMRRI